MITQSLLLIAGVFALLGSLGLFRFRDFYVRSHAATMISVGGVMFALFVLMLDMPWFGVHFFKILIILVLMLLTGPTATHAIANRAYSIGVAPKQLIKNQMESRPGGGDR